MAVLLFTMVFKKYPKPIVGFYSERSTKHFPDDVNLYFSNIFNIEGILELCTFEFEF